ncbi:putative reverse transcriptase domain-containing protein [Tanacetum coccineum]
MRVCFLVLEHHTDTLVFIMMMEILPEPTSNKLCGSDETSNEPEVKAKDAIIANTKYTTDPVDGKIIGADTIIYNFTLNDLNHPFNIDVMPVELGSFDVIISMDWLSKYHVVIVCDEKIVRIPYGDEVLTINGDGSDEKKAEDKSKEKRLEDVPTVQDFPKVFPKDFPGIPPTRQFEFQIDLVPGATPVVLHP